MFNWLVAVQYLHGNPLLAALTARDKLVDRAAAGGATRFLSLDQWREVQQTIQAMPVKTPRQIAHAVRARWVFTLLYLAALRSSEACEAPMNAFSCKRSIDGQTRWWLHIVGKGKHQRDVPVSPELLSELQRYRLANGLAALPTHDDDSPLIRPLIKPIEPISRASLHELVKAVLGATAKRLVDRGTPEDGEVAANLERASAHWMRHTAATHQIGRGVQLAEVRDNLGHANIATTNQYVHTEAQDRHDRTSAAHQAGWDDGRG
jgi:site-specific recombinase XerD